MRPRRSTYPGGYIIRRVKIVIVGGVAGGMSAATRLRRLLDDAEIVVLERSGHVSYANCGLPYHVGGVIEERSALLLQTPDSLAARFGLDVRVRHEVTSLDVAAKEVAYRDLAAGTEGRMTYDALVLSPGAAPYIPPFPGSERALPLRSVEDTDAMAAAAAGARTAVVMGAGFIGLEVAENLRDRGLEVTVVELASQVLAPLDPELAVLVADELGRQGVAVRTGVSVVSYDGAEAQLSDGTLVPADLLVAGIGVRPESSLARDAGLDVTSRGLIVVDDQLRTSAPDVYAVGDAITKVDAVDGGATATYLANLANREGRRVADVISGRKVTLPPALGTAIVKVFGLTAAVTGWNEKRARAAGRAIRVIHSHPADHAGYYPGAETMALKLVIDAETDAILGAQGVGGSGVDKRIDVIATAIRGGLKASDLIDLDLAYAPPYGSAKDPVNHLGYVAENLASGVSESVQWWQLADAIEGGAQLVDVRTADEHGAGAIPGSVLVPVDELRDRLDELGADVIVHCAVGIRGHTAARILAATGRRARNLDGGYKTWSAAHDVATRERRVDIPRGA